MKIISITLFALLSVFLVSTPARAYWPTTVHENLAVSADPDTFELECTALHYTDNSTLVVFRQGYIGAVYQIIDKYGEKKYLFPQKLTPSSINNAIAEPHIIADGAGGAFTVWDSFDPNPEGIVAQRLDSLGNLMWGDSGVVISPFEEQDFDICIDGEGGLFLAIAPDEPDLEQQDIWAQRVDGEGNILWGDQGVLVCGLASTDADKPVVTYDGSGVAYVIWRDARPPYWPFGALFAQRIDGHGNTMWAEDLFICENVWFHQVIPDGEGGFILHANPGGSPYNTVWRVNSIGNILWEHDHVSWYAHAGIAPGEQGFFYLGYTHEGVYGQKMDIEGNFYWPSWPASYGALMACYPGYYHLAHECYFYEYPCFYGVFDLSTIQSYPYFFGFQKLDSLGNRLLGENGVVMCSIYAGGFQHSSAVPDGEGGVVLVYYHYATYDVYAKRCRADGTLGGALHLLVDLTPHNPPIQIPPSGGSFIYDIAIEDTYSVAGVFDAWIEVSLPGGDSLELLVREDLTIESNSTILRTDLQQFVPYRAPAGEYNYTAYVGNHEYYVVWSEDSFTFEKLPGIDSGRASLAGMTTEGWMLEGFFDGSLEGSIESASAKSPAGLSRLSAFPNPFNDETVISYWLTANSFIQLVIYDIQGREVSRLFDDWQTAGKHTASWNGKDCTSGIYFVRLKTDEVSVVRKVLLVK